jgi:hypothetical protein
MRMRQDFIWDLSGSTEVFHIISQTVGDLKKSKIMCFGFLYNFFLKYFLS